MAIRVSNPCSRLLVGTILAMTACRSERADKRSDSTQVRFQPTQPVPGVSGSRSMWELRLGPFFVVPGANGELAYLIYPEFTSDVSLDSVEFDFNRFRGASVELVADGRSVGSARMESVSADRVDACPSWPMARLVRPTNAEGAPKDWTVGLAAGVATLPVEWITSLSTKDSLQLTVAVARLASGLPGDTASVFRGRPFIVRQLARIGADPTRFLLAEVVRTIDQEAMPLQEHLLIVADPDSSERSGYRVAYFERSIGYEDVIETTELLAAMALDTTATVLLVSREQGDGVSYAALERISGQAWRVRWTSAFAGC